MYATLLPSVGYAPKLASNSWPENALRAAIANCRQFSLQLGRGFACRVSPKHFELSHITCRFEEGLTF